MEKRKKHTFIFEIMMKLHCNNYHYHHKSGTLLCLFHIIIRRPACIGFDIDCRIIIIDNYTFTTITAVTNVTFLIKREW